MVSEYTGFIYLWYDKKRKYFCIGSHFGKLDDGYTSSTGIFQRAYKKRPSDFRRRVIHLHYGDKKSLLKKEQYFLDRIKHVELFLSDNIHNQTVRYYNIKKNASGLSGKVASDLRSNYYKTERGIEWKKQLSVKFKVDNPIKLGNVPWNKGIKAESISVGRKNGRKRIYTEEDFRTISEKTSKAWREGSFDTRPVPSKEHIAKMHDAWRGRSQSDYQKQMASEANKVKSTCTHCGKEGGGNSMKRWHFDNCKMKIIAV